MREPLVVNRETVIPLYIVNPFHYFGYCWHGDVP